MVPYWPVMSSKVMHKAASSKFYVADRIFFLDFVAV